jgi:hypothetical protein
MTLSVALAIDPCDAVKPPRRRVHPIVGDVSSPLKPVSLGCAGLPAVGPEGTRRAPTWARQPGTTSTGWGGRPEQTSTTRRRPG